MFFSIRYSLLTGYFKDVKGDQGTILIAIFPVFCPVSTYRVASIMASKAYVRSISALYFRCSIRSLINSISVLVSFGIGKITFLAPSRGVKRARKIFCDK